MCRPGRSVGVLGTPCDQAGCAGMLEGTPDQGQEQEES